MPIDLDPIADPAADQATRDKSQRLAAYWKEAIDSVKDSTRKYHKRADRIIQRYRDERARVDEDSQRRYNMLWANTQTMRPAIYGKAPQPVVERRFRDKDPTGRYAASMLERGLRNEVEVNGFHGALKRAVMDYLLPGTGQCWVRYEPEIEESVSIPIEDEMDLRDTQGQIVPEDEDTGETDPDKIESEEKLRDTGDRIKRETVPVDYVPYKDFLTFPFRARTWDEVVAVGKRVHMSRDQMKRRFGDIVGKKIPLQGEGRTDRRQTETIVHEDDEDRKGEVYEIWSRADEKVYWVADGYDFLCDMKDDPLHLEKFFPCPEPLYANPTNDTLIPVPFYVQYQDQAIQADELTQRISMLTKACKVAGVYNAADKNIQRLLDESVENELIPVDNWAAFAEKGGVSGAISLLPLKEIIGVINELSSLKDKVIAEADRLTGITDIMRGTTDARETMGAQRLKSNAGGTRLSELQNEVARFCRDVVRLMAEVMSIHFSPQSLIEVSGALFEEGLGSPDMPPMSTFGQPGAMPQGPAMPGMPMSGTGQPPQIGAPPMPGTAPGMPPHPPQIGNVPPQIGGPTGQNVVPFQRPGLPAPIPPQQPPGMPMAQPGMVPQPQLSPELASKMEGLKRIAAGINLLRDDNLRGFRVDIEVDSTVYGDAVQEKQDRIEFVESVTKYLGVAGQLGAQVPQAAPLLGKLLQFAVRGFRVGRDLESAIDDFVDEAEKLAEQKADQMQSQQGQPNPEQVKAQAAMATAQSDLQQAKIKAQSDAQTTQMKAQADQQAAAAEVQKQQLDAQAMQADSNAETQRTMMDMKMQAMEMEIEKYKMQTQVMQMHIDQHKATLDALKPPNPPQQSSLGRPL